MSEQKLATGWSVAKVEANKTEGPAGDRKRVSVGFYSLPYATIGAFKQAVDEATVNVEASAISKDNPEGIAVYTHADSGVADIANWLQSAILAKIKVKGSNMLVSGTNELMSGKAFPTDFETLLEPGERGGEFLKLKAESVTGFTTYLQGLGKEQRIVDGFRAMFRNPAEVMAHQPAKYKAKMQEYLTGFASTLTPENLERYKKFLVAVEDACAGNDEDDMLS